MKPRRPDPTGSAFHSRLALISVKIKDNEAFKPSEPLSARGHTETFDMERQGEKRSGKTAGWLTVSDSESETVIVHKQFLKPSTVAVLYLLYECVLI